MIGRLWRWTVRFFASPKLALVLIVLVGAWSLLATAVPQGPVASHDVVEWAAEYGVVAPIVRAVGLHGAFGAPVFLVLASLLTISTAVCSWNRTRAALARTRVLRSARGWNPATVAEKQNFAVACGPGLSENDVVARARESLGALGIKAEERRDALVAVSSSWSVWGSPLFHWSLVLLVLAALGGQLVRSEGSMAIAVGDAKPDKPESYRFVKAGPLHDWGRVNRTIRVDAFEPALAIDGLDYGAVPTVSVLDSNGTVLVTQQVRANDKLHTGSLSMNAPACGLAVRLELIDPQGTVIGEVVPLVDFSQEASGGTVPERALALRNAQGQVLLQLVATVPLDRAPEGGYGEWIPERPRAQVFLADGTDKTLFEGEIPEGETVPLVGGGSLRLASIGWFSQLSLVDDPSIPFVYAAMIAAMVGLTISLVGRQQIVAAAPVQGPDGLSLAVTARLWRNSSATRDEIEHALAGALGNDQEGASS